MSIFDTQLRNRTNYCRSFQLVVKKIEIGIPIFCINIWCLNLLTIICDGVAYVFETFPLLLFHETVICFPPHTWLVTCWSKFSNLLTHLTEEMKLRRNVLGRVKPLKHLMVSCNGLPETSNGAPVTTADKKKHLWNLKHSSEVKEELWIWLHISCYHKRKLLTQNIHGFGTQT